MIVGFDISQTAYPGGVAVYTQVLASHLSKNHDLQMKFFYSSLRKPYQGSLPNVKSFPLPPTLTELLFNRIRVVPIEAFLGDINLFHSSDWTQPQSRAKKVTTYHDVVPLKYPQWSNPKIVTVHRRRLEIVEKEVDMVIAVSEATRQDLLEITKIPEKKICVIYEAADDIFQPQEKEKVEIFRKKYHLPKDFILAIGGIGERRNLKNIKEAILEYPLIVTGRDSYWFPKDEMPLLYSAASFLLYPSLYEGFGLPILEAFSCGCPVVTSNRSSMKEIASDAAILIDPEDVSDIRRGIKEALKQKEKLIKRGFIRAKDFSWQKTTQATIKVYQQVLS